MSEISTQQEKKKGNPNPSPDTRFGAPKGNPQSPGGWSKEGSISYQYQKLIRMSKAELIKFEKEEADTMTIAQEIALNRVKAARSHDSGLHDTKEITDRTEGKAPQMIGFDDADNLRKVLVEIVDADNNTDTEGV